MMPEATSDDRTAVVLETGGDLSRSGLTDILSGAELSPTFLAPTTAGARICYAEVEGFVGPDDLRLMVLLSCEAIKQITIIGTYATPIGDPALTAGETK